MKMYTTDDIQNMLYSLQQDPAKRETFISLLDSISKSDRGPILYIINNGVAEDFNRYDSDVCESFIRLYETMWEDK